MHPAIEVRDLRKTYPNHVRALDGLTFSVEPGTIFALLGPNGAGKTTAVKILNTLSRPDSGSALVGGIDVLRDPENVRRTIGCVMQKSGIDGTATGRENLTLQGRIYGLGGAALKERASELLARFGLTEAADLLAATYSGGMQRKLDIAMGLIHRPRLLFLDEPTTGLDPKARSEMWEQTSRMANTEGMTVLLTTHYLEEADHLAQRVAIVDRGHIVAEGAPEQLKGELFGDAIHIDLAGPAPDGRLEAALGGLDWLREVAVEGASVRARAGQGATAVPPLLAAIEAEGVRVASVTVARPSLDDVYLRHTGRSFDEADQGGSR